MWLRDGLPAAKVIIVILQARVMMDRVSLILRRYSTPASTQDQRVWGDAIEFQMFIGIAVIVKIFLVVI